MIRRLPDVDPMRSGAVQFGDDWPGVFIRGDEIDGWAQMLEQCAVITERKAGACSAADLLRECAAKARNLADACFEPKDT